MHLFEALSQNPEWIIQNYFQNLLWSILYLAIQFLFFFPLGLLFHLKLHRYKNAFKYLGLLPSLLGLSVFAGIIGLISFWMGAHQAQLAIFSLFIFQFIFCSSLLVIKKIKWKNYFKLPSHLLLLTLLIFLLSIQTLWRPFPSGVDSQRNGNNIHRIEDQDSYPDINLSDSKNIIYTSPYPPIINSYLDIYYHYFHIPTEKILLSFNFITITSLMLALYFVLCEFLSPIQALAGVSFMQTFVFYIEMFAQTQVTECLGALYLLLLLLYFYRRPNKNTYQMFLGFLLGSCLLAHGRFFKWLGIFLAIELILEIKNKPTRVLLFIKQYMIIICTALLIAGPWLYKVRDLIKDHSASDFGFWFLYNFGSVNIIAPHRYFDLIVFFIGLIWMFNKVILTQKQSALQVPFMYSLVGIFFGGEYFRAYGNFLIEPIVLLIGFLIIFKSIKIVYPNLSLVKFFTLVAGLNLMYANYPKYSWIYSKNLLTKSDYETLECFRKKKYPLNFKILNPPTYGGKWVPGLVPQISIFARYDPFIFTSEIRDFYSYWESIYNNPTSDVIQLLNSESIAFVFIDEQNQTLIQSWMKSQLELDSCSRNNSFVLLNRSLIQ